jgi:hypothetical protein
MNEKWSNLLVVMILISLLLSACGETEVEVTRRVEVTPIFDAEAETEAVMSVVQAMFDAFAVPDGVALRALFHGDYEDFSIWPNAQYRSTSGDFNPDMLVSTIMHWDDHSVIVTPDLAVIKGLLTHTTDNTGTNQFYQTFVLIKEDGEWKFIHGHGSHAW